MDYSSLQYFSISSFTLSNQTNLNTPENALHVFFLSESNHSRKCVLRISLLFSPTIGVLILIQSASAAEQTKYLLHKCVVFEYWSSLASSGPHNTIHFACAIFSFTPLTFQMTTDYYSAFAGVPHAGISTLASMVPNMFPVESDKYPFLICNETSLTGYRLWHFHKLALTRLRCFYAATCLIQVYHRSHWLAKTAKKNSVKLNNN